MLTPFLFLFGLVIGSFLNVVVLRLEAGKSLGGRSECPSCGATIHWYDNIPVISYFVLGRQCRACHYPIDWQYPIVESLTGVLFAWVGTLSFGAGTMSEVVLTTWHLFLVGILITIAVYDLRNMEIPLILLLVGVGGAVVYGVSAILLPSSALGSAQWREMLIGGSIGVAIFYALVYFSRETWMGMGDVWLAGIAGAAVGFSSLLLLFTITFSLGAGVGLALMFYGKRGMKSQIPFAPFLALGIVSVIVLQSYDPWWLPLFLLPTI